MSLNQLTANYTDSEEEEDIKQEKELSISPEDKDDSTKESNKGTPASLGSGTNTPKKKVLLLTQFDFFLY